jgi:7,8-didemethyl-8-hydroxy-5-deazariboflavin synthase CofG subunit
MTPPVVTFSRNVTVPVTRLCRNRCGYCGFRDENGNYLRWKDIHPLLLDAEEKGCCEALFMAGERPEMREGKARRFLSEEGFGSTAEYVAWLCGRTLDETQLLPHTNVGVLDAEELRRLKEVNASLGLMLEDASPRLCGPGMPHGDSPGKRPSDRLHTIDEAGRLRIPFTTGVLVGIGQTKGELMRSLTILKKIQEKRGHIQEVIIQRFLPKPATPMEGHPTPATHLMINAVAVARLVFGPSMNLQVPPNIERNFDDFLRAGANDLGGVSPITHDYINPEEPWCSEDEIFKKVSSTGLRATLRPPVYPRYARPEFLSPVVLARTKAWLDRT